MDKPVTIGEAKRRFFAYPDIQELAHSTQINKLRAIDQLIAVVGREDFVVSFLTYEHFDQTMERLRNGASEEENKQRKLLGQRPRSGRGALALRIDRSSLKQFAEFMRMNKWVDPWFQPLFQLTRSAKEDPDGKTRTFRILAESDFKTLLEIAGAHHPRTRAMIAIGLYGGRRHSEMRLLQIKHLHLAESTMDFRNVKKGRTIMGREMVPELTAELETYLAWYKREYGELQPDWFVLPAKVRGSDMKGDELASLVSETSRLWPLRPERMVGADALPDDAREMLLRLGWGDLLGEGMHTLRRAHAEWIKKHHGMRAGQLSLDHKSMATFEGYLRHSSREDEFRELVTGKGDNVPSPPTARTSEPGMAPVIDLFTRRQVS
jgi:integrase